MSDLNSILADLAAGRIVPAEAARLIDALKTDSPASTGDQAEGPAGERFSDESLGEESHDADSAEAATTDSSEVSSEPLVAEGEPDADEPSVVNESEGGRPQFATHTRESFRSEPSETESSEAATDEATAKTEPAPSVKQGVEVDPDELPDSGPKAAGSAPKGSKGVERVTIRSVGRRLRVIGDSSVATLSATGPHILRRSGRVIEVTSDGEIGPSLDSFSIINPPRSFEDLRTLGFGAELVVRVNPDIVVDAEVTGGSLNISKIPALGKVRVTAGSATLEDVAVVADCLVQAGSAAVKGDIRTGRSRVKVESGSLTITLGKEANVTISGEAQMGRINWPGEHGQVHEYVVGNGSAKLDIGVVMGLATLKVHPEAEDQE